MLKTLEYKQVMLYSYVTITCKYVTGFGKTDRIVTITEIHFITYVIATLKYSPEDTAATRAAPNMLD